MRTVRSRMEDSTFDINLAPMLDIIVSIVPLLLLSTVFLKVTVIDSPIPQAVAKAIENDRNKKDHDLTIAIHASATGLKIVVNEKGHEQEVQVTAHGKTQDLEKLHSEMIKIKQRFPQTFRLELYPSEELSYNDIVAVLDQVRNRRVADPQIFFTEESTGKKIETDFMFPDVVFANVVGG